MAHQLIIEYQTRSEEGYCVGSEQYQNIRYNHIGEMVQYFEEKIFNREKKKLKQQGIYSEEAKEQARKKAWVDFFPCRMNNLIDTSEITKEEEEAYDVGRIQDAIKSLMNRLKKELQPKFKKAAKIRDLSNSESISFSVTSFAQIVDWILTFGVA